MYGCRYNLKRRSFQLIFAALILLFSSISYGEIDVGAKATREQALQAATKDLSVLHKRHSAMEARRTALQEDIYEELDATRKGEIDKVFVEHVELDLYMAKADVSEIELALSDAQQTILIINRSIHELEVQHQNLRHTGK